MKLSVVTFIYWPEEETLLEGCLRSVKFADEIIIIDNGATAKTLEIAKKYTDKIYPCADKSFAARHNFAKDKANGDWLLYIDSDERVSKKLAREIVKANEFDAYQLRRIDYRLGKNFDTDEFITRLFRKSKLSEWTGDIHESSHVDGKIGKFSEPLYHFTHRNIFTMVAKTVNFGENEADIRLKLNHPPVVWWRLVRVFVTEFIYRVIMLRGWRQGTEGWIDGILQSFSMFVTYARLWEKQQEVPLEEKYKELDKKIETGEL